MRKPKIVLVQQHHWRGHSESVVHRMNMFGVAEHHWECIDRKRLEYDPEDVGTLLISEARKGDFYRFVRNAGGGGGHRLIVQRFQVITYLNKADQDCC